MMVDAKRMRRANLTDRSEVPLLISLRIRATAFGQVLQ
jgi:hypothetical protein